MYKHSSISSAGRLVEFNSLFITSMTPLLLRTKDGNKVLWKNKTPSSYRYNRPISIEFTRETETYVSRRFQDLRNQVSEISTVPIYINDFKINVKCSFFMSSVDGKILNFLTKTLSKLSYL